MSIPHATRYHIVFQYRTILFGMCHIIDDEKMTFSHLGIDTIYNV